MSLFDKFVDLFDETNEEKKKEQVDISKPTEDQYNKFAVNFLQSHKITQVRNRKEVLTAGEIKIAKGFTVKTNKEMKETLRYEVYPNRKKEEIIHQGQLPYTEEKTIEEDGTVVDTIVIFILGDTKIGEYKIGNGSKTITNGDFTMEVSDYITTEVEPYMGQWGRDAIEDTKKQDEKDFIIGYSEGDVKNLNLETTPVKEYDKHAYLSGVTGYGKSTILINKAKQITEYGNNIVMITPKNDDALKVIQTLTDEELEKTDFLRIGDVESQNVVSYNIFDLSDMTPSEKEKYIGDEVETFVAMMTSKFGTGGIIGPVSESIAKPMMMSEKKYSMADFVKVIADDEYRSKFVDEITTELNKYPEYLHNLESFDSDELDSISRRIKTFEEKEALRQLTFSNDSDISFMDYITGDRNLIVDLELLGEEEKALVGIMIIRELWVSAKRRAQKIPESQRDIAFTIIDEVQDIITKDNYEKSHVGTILQQARQKKLSLITASQSPNQLYGPFREELGNIHIKIPLYTSTGTGFYSSHFNSVGSSSTVTSGDIGNLQKYQSILQSNPRKPPVIVNNFSTYPPLISEMNARDVRRRLINRTGSERVPNKSLNEITIVGQTDGESSDDTDEEDEIWAIARAIDIAQRFYKYQTDEYIEHETRDKAEYVDSDIIKDVLSVIGYDYGYNDFDQFIENHGYYFETRIDTSGSKKVTQYGLTAEGQKLADRQDSGSSSSGGKTPHRKMLSLVREELAKYGVAVIVPQQEGEMSDGMGYIFRDTGNEAVQKLVSEAEPNKIMIEAESTTGQKQPNQTVHNGAKIMQTGAKAVFLFRERSEAEKNENRLIEMNGYRKQYRDDEFLLYTLSGRSDYLKQDSVRGNAKYPVRPRNNSSKSTLWVHRTSADPSRAYVLKDNEEYEHAHISLDKLANDNWNMEDFPAYYYEQDGEIIVKQDGKVVDKYTDLQYMKEEWMPIKKPRIPEYEFGDTGMPTRDDITHIVLEYDEHSGGGGEFYVFEDGENYYFDQSTTTQTTDTSTQTTQDDDSSIADKLDF